MHLTGYTTNLSGFGILQSINKETPELMEIAVLTI
jgi:hypothetical protein